MTTILADIDRSCQVFGRAEKETQAGVQVEQDELSVKV